MPDDEVNDIPELYSQIVNDGFHVVDISFNRAYVKRPQRLVVSAEYDGEH